MKNEISAKKGQWIESKTTLLEINHNSLEQCGCRNKIEITNILDSVPDQNLEILKEIDVNVSTRKVDRKEK